MRVVNKVVGNDTSIKYYLATDSKKEEIVECCLLNLKKHGTVICISSQIGCTQNCAFCASGAKKSVRNLEPEEIISQVRYIVEDEPQYFKNWFQITYMGSGEPFNNFVNVLSTCDSFFFAYPDLTKINISTVLPGIENSSSEFDRFKGKMHIQFSLHFTDTARRNIYMGKKLPAIDDSIEYLNNLSDILEDKYSINYILFDGLNDTAKDAQELIKIVNKSKGYLKISELSLVKGSRLIKSSNEDGFMKIIRESGVEYEKFNSMGTDINAGCGQFYNESIL